MPSIKELYDSKNFPSVSPATRTSIINAIGIDLEGLIIQQGGKFTEAELANGLRYLLTRNPELHMYIDDAPSANLSGLNNPFFVPVMPSAWDCLLLDLTMSNSCGHHHHHGTGCVGSSSSGNDEDTCKGIMGVLLVLVACFCCAIGTLSTCDTMQGKEGDVTIGLKTGANLLSFIVGAGLSWFAFSNILNQADDYYFYENAAISFFVGATCFALVSFINNCIKCIATAPSTPSTEILNELQTIKRLLETTYYQPGVDDPAQCRAFTKQVVCYYLQSISKDVVNISENTPLISKHSTTLFYQPALDDRKNLGLKNVSLALV